MPPPMAAFRESTELWAGLLVMDSFTPQIKSYCSRVRRTPKSGLHHSPQHHLVDLSGDSQALLKEERKHDVPLAGDVAKDHGRRKLRMLHGGNLIHVFADRPIVLPVVWYWMIFFSLEKNLSIPADPCLSSFSKTAALTSLDNLQAFVMSMRRSSTCDSPCQRRSWRSSGFCLLDGGDDLVGLNRTNVVGLSFGSKLVHVLTRLPLPPNVHDHGPLEPKQGHHFRRLLPGAKSYYRCSAFIFNPGVG
ncbi:unnamed protein product [Acanthosepion pharaonis]|uniref:Uncharacterized protein n=1 Tax=Acanthosepion pharaonis TaxID=158019 RepID=A0A812BC66_ACAPH|nr:unnamed protein product [Sepia pharaonis]